MRQGQQNRRGRNRNRKSQNPLTRSFESNGPDVKIRGTPAHVAEKYMSLARDALASGDPVLGENYLQHAEHYNRIIMAYREQQTGGGEQVNGQRTRNQDHVGDDDAGDDAGDEYMRDGAEAGDGEQPRLNGNGHAFENGRGRGRRDARAVGDDDEDSGERQPRERRPRNGNGNGDGDRQRRSGRTRAASRETNREDGSDVDDQPDFLKRPIRRTRRTSDDVDAKSDDNAPTAPPSSEDGDAA